MNLNTHNEIAESLGAYALYAVGAEEAAKIQAHLMSCAICREELSQHVDTASRLSNDGDSPAELWGRIATRLDERPAVMPIGRLGEAAPDRHGQRRRPPTGPWLGRGVAAVCVIAAVVSLAGGATAIQGAARLSTLEDKVGSTSVAQSATNASNDPSSTHVTLTSSDSDHYVDVVVFDKGNGYVVKGSLPETDSSKTYQLWAQTGDRTISMGILGHKIDPTAFIVPSGTSRLAITEEVGTGVVQPTGQPVVSSPVRSV